MITDTDYELFSGGRKPQIHYGGDETPAEGSSIRGERTGRVQTERGTNALEKQESEHIGEGNRLNSGG